MFRSENWPPSGPTLGSESGTAGRLGAAAHRANIKRYEADETKFQFQKSNFSSCAATPRIARDPYLNHMPAAPSSPASRPAEPRSHRPGLDPRDQTRRLPDDRPRRGQAGAAIHPHRPRLDQPLSADRRNRRVPKLGGTGRINNFELVCAKSVTAMRIKSCQLSAI
jgi:hypothetical protein